MPNNKMVKTQVDVQKYWHDAPGFSGVHDGVEVQLYQSKTDPSGKTDGPTITVGYIDGNGKKDKQSFTVQPGADAVMRMKTYSAWLTNGTEAFGINGQGINWYNIPEQHRGKLIIANNDPQIKQQTNYVENNIPADWYDQEGWYNEFEITYKNVTEDMEFIFYFTGPGKYKDYSQYKLLVDISEPDAVKGLPDDAVAIGDPVTLNNDNNWYYKWDNIPKTDEYGYNYYYYVQEVTTVTDYTPGYDNNGANEGTINITNKGKGYTNEMPKTGGIGNKPMIITGIILISGSSVLYILSKRRRKRC